MIPIGLVFNGPPYQTRDMVSAVKMAEVAGFHSAWHAEDVYGPDAITMLASYAQVTERLKLGTALINPNTRYPALIANTFATLDQVSRGRIILGLGAGLTWLPLVGKVAKDVKSLTLMRDTIRLLRSVWAGEDLQINGQDIYWYGCRVSLPRAFNWPWGGFKIERDRIPIYVGAKGPKMIEMAGALADGLIVEHSVPLHGIRTWVDSFLSAADSAGRVLESLEVAGLILFSPSENGRPDSTLYSFVAGLRIVSLKPSEIDELGFDPALVERIRGLWQEGRKEEAGKLVTREMLDCFGVFGTPDECVSKLKLYRRAGITIPLIMPEACDIRLAVETGAAFAASQI